MQLDYFAGFPGWTVKRKPMNLIGFGIPFGKSMGTGLGRILRGGTGLANPAGPRDGHLTRDPSRISPARGERGCMDDMALEGKDRSQEVGMLRG